MKKLIVALLIIALLIPSSMVLASSGAPGTWVSSINIQNPSSSDATVSLVFYNATGDVALTWPVPGVIPAGGFRTVYVPAATPELPSGQYSVVASSTTPVNIIVNSSSTSPYTAGAYNGLLPTDVGTKLYFPGLYNNYYGFYSEMVIQNTSSLVANISIQFYGKTGAPEGAPYTHVIPVGASAVFTLSELFPALPSGNSATYSATVTSDVAIGGIANTWSAYMHGEYATYNGSADGALEAYVPSLLNKYYGFQTALSIQNVDTAPATVTVTYSNGHTVTKTIDPNTKAELIQPNDPDLPSGNTLGIFSAKVVSDKKIIALVNVEDKLKGSLASWNASPIASNDVLCSVVMREYYKWFTAETVMNAGSTQADVTITYSDGKTRTITVPPLGTFNVIEQAVNGSVLDPNSVLSAKFSSTNPLVVVVQENSTSYSTNPGDYLLAYTCTADMP